MNLRNLLIAFAITLSPVIQAGPIKWIKDNAVPLAIGIAGVSAAVIYMSQPDDNDALEIPNHSPTSEHPQYMLSLAKRHSNQRASRTQTMDNGDSITQESGNRTIVVFQADSKLPNRPYNRNAKPIKSSLKNAAHEHVHQQLKIQAPDTAAFKVALAQAIETDRANLNQKTSESSIVSLCQSNRSICALYHAQSLCFKNHPEITFSKRIEWAQDLLTEL